MAWSDPKVDWAASDAVAASDLNRIEENIHVGQRFLAGIVGGSSARSGLSASVDTLLQRQQLAVASGYTVVIERAQYHWSTVNAGLVILISGGSGSATTYTNTASSDDTDPGFTIYDNTTGGTENVDLQLYSTPTGAVTYSLETYDSWSIKYSLRAP